MEDDLVRIDVQEIGGDTQETMALFLYCIVLYCIVLYTKGVRVW